eukprot:CAMPEP_0184858964 /NCGR_PEP_ID=MMETSP0580-20130426/3986_1 /TAXON_ID=1118495 /ORGANISM="Dactyliosolen fragilissimus" /LENGTH=293 /DNA_ID=CAMNT_0027355345 /DNA_START=79 /DNA_END=960 /DNA_ORIENTATION=-
MATSSSSSSAANKLILVTGGNKGIGKAICEKLLKETSDVHVLLGSRDVSRGEQAVKDLTSAIPSAAGRVEAIQIDTQSDESVSSAAAQCQSKTLYGIVNNAGVLGKGYHTTIDTNYFGIRRVNDAFSPFLQRPGGRIVNIASASGPNFVYGCSSSSDLKKKLGNPAENLPEGMKGIQELDAMASKFMKNDGYGDEYGLSKALVNAYTVLYGKQEASNGIYVNSCSPGYILTDMTRDAGLNPTNPPSMGANAPFYLLMSDDMKTLPTGRYYGSDSVRSPLHFYRGPGDPPYEGP